RSAKSIAPNPPAPCSDTKVSWNLPQRRLLDVVSVAGIHSAIVILDKARGRCSTSPQGQHPRSTKVGRRGGTIERVQPSPVSEIRVGRTPVQAIVNEEHLPTKARLRARSG